MTARLARLEISKPQSSLRSKLDSFRLSQRLQIDSQLLALLVEVAALQA
jgi:hypothetical protein